MQQTDFEAFRNSLVSQLEFPTIYMFKFKLKHELCHAAQIESWFDADAVIQSRLSRNKQYISITVRQAVLNADDIIYYYKKAQHIEGLICL